jgi:dCMP deaminase
MCGTLRVTGAHDRPRSVTVRRRIQVVRLYAATMGMTDGSTGAYPFLDDITALLEPYQPDEGEKRNDQPSWDEYFHAVAQAVALKSRDRGRKVGAVVVGEGHRILSTGFNGFARKIRETDARQDDDEKLFWTTHAETNAIFNAARGGVSLVGATLFVTLFPCYGCAQAIVQAGITRVFTYGTGYWIKAEPEQSNRWEIALGVLAEAHVAVDAPMIRLKDISFWEDAKRAKNLGRRRKDAPRPTRPQPTANRTSRAQKKKR